MSNKISLQHYDEDDNYEISDSDDYYTETEKALLKKATKQRKKYEDSEEEVFEINSSSDDDDNSDKNADSDIENVNDNLPDDRAWGKRKKSYYSTDYVDADLNAFNAKDVDAAQFEEEEARKIQQRLLDQFDEDDFSLDIYKSKVKNFVENRLETTKIKKDLSKFLDSEKRDLILKESPELIGLIDDFKVKMDEMSNTLGPLLDIFRVNQLEDDNFIQYFTLKYNILMRYLIYVNFYVLLKSQRVNVKYHPVVKQIIKYRELYSQLESVNTDILKKKVHKILTTQQLENKKPSKTKLKITKTKQNINKEVEKPKKVHFEESNPDKTKSDSSSDENEAMEIEDLQNENNEVVTDKIEGGKRAITYEIAKNKGLTPHRKKELRNPRVKHRNKYRQAKIRRKGAVREVRKELSRYGGELSGIKSNVTKSIKIK